MLQKKLDSVGYAFKGIRVAYVEESNFQIQLVIGVVALIAGLYFRISQFEWLIIILSAGFVLTSELFNTALEELCDMLKSSHDPHVGKIKDLAAGAVLVSSSSALLIGLMIFIPKLLAL